MAASSTASTKNKSKHFCDLKSAAKFRLFHDKSKMLSKA